jgi:hypothetical protein
MSIIVCQVGSSISHDLTGAVPMPALALMMSSLPSWATPSSSAALSPAYVADVGLGGHDPPVERLDLLNRLGEVGLGGARVGKARHVLE